MRTRLFLGTMGISSAALLTMATLTACAQEYPRYTPGYSAPVYVAPPVGAVVPVVAPLLSEAQLDTLLGPIALYPDPLLAQVLPAATYPLEIVNAARWVQAYPNADESIIAAQAWEPSIKAIVHYPTVLKLLNDNLDWTQTLGVAFLNQPNDVMESIQRLRRQAQIVGALQSNQQQQVLIAGNAIEILPTDPQIIYVPIYDPQVVYAPQPVVYVTPVEIARPPLILFGGGIRIGLWLDNDCDWDRHWIIVGGGWHQGWQHNDRGWEREPRDIRPPAPHRPEERPAPVVQHWAHNPTKAPPIMPLAVRAAARPAPDTHRGWPASASPPAAPPIGRAPMPINVPRPTPDKVRPAEPTHRDPPPVIARPAEPIPVRPHTTPPIPVAPAPAHAEPKLPPAPAPAIRPAPGGAFNGYQSRGEVQRNVDRAQESKPGLNPPTATPRVAPAPAPNPPQPRPAPTILPRVQTQTPAPPPPAAPTPAARPAPAPVPAPRPAPAPAPTAAPVLSPPPHSVAPSPPPRVQTPAPTPPAPQVRQAPAPPPAAAQPAFKDIAPNTDVQKQSSRGHDSLKGH
ncbi:MAG: DUF3300 domain-containing protein [Phycisphaerae bacterium]